MEWREIGFNDHRYVEPSGRIVGGYKKEWRTWAAWLERVALGDYIDEASAKAAVEAHFRVSLNPFFPNFQSSIGSSAK